MKKRVRNLCKNTGCKLVWTGEGQESHAAMIRYVM